MVVLSHITEGAPETQCVHSRRCLAQQQLPQVIFSLLRFDFVKVFKQERIDLRGTWRTMLSDQEVQEAKLEKGGKQFSFKIK